MQKLLLATGSAAALASAATAQTTDTAMRRAELLQQRAEIDAQLRALDGDAAAPAPQTTEASGRDIVVTGKALSLTTQVTGQTVTTVDDSAFRNTPATTIADIVKLSPGVAVIQGNGPRDVGVSVRGSNARNSFGARNIQVFEDDFPVTQPDGLARFDLTDPHAYGAVDVVRGPSSARYGNYAMGGAVNFRTRRGRDIDGVEVGTDVGGDGYANVYATIGNAGPDYEYSAVRQLRRARTARPGIPATRPARSTPTAPCARRPRPRLRQADLQRGRVPPLDPAVVQPVPRQSLSAGVRARGDRGAGLRHDLGVSQRHQRRTHRADRGRRRSRPQRSPHDRRHPVRA